MNCLVPGRQKSNINKLTINTIIQFIRDKGTAFLCKECSKIFIAVLQHVFLYNNSFNNFNLPLYVQLQSSGIMSKYYTW